MTIKFNDIVYCVSQINTPIAYQVIALSESQALCRPVVKDINLQKLVHWEDLDKLSLNLSTTITLCSFNHDARIALVVEEFTRVYHAWSTIILVREKNIIVAFTSHFFFSNHELTL